MFSDKKFLPVSKNESVRDYWWNEQITDKLEMAFYVVDDEYREFRNSFVAFASPDDNSHYIRERVIKDA